MSYSFSENTGDGTTKTFPFSFTGPDNGYFDNNSIKVEVNGVRTEDFTLTGPTQITFTTAPDDGAKVRILREPDVNAPYTDFSRGNAFGKDNINRSFQQQLYIAHRYMDGFKDEGYYEKQDLSLGGYKIRDIADGTLNTDVATVGQVGANNANTFLYMTRAETAADESEASAIASQDSADSIGNSVAVAAASADAAGDSEDAADVSEIAAASSAGDAFSYATSSYNSSTSSRDYRDQAEDYKDDAATSASAASYSADDADFARSLAVDAQNYAITANINASSAADAAGLSETAAGDSEDAASASALQASNSESAASTYASNASGSATNSYDSSISSRDYRDAAAISAGDAETARSLAVDARDAASGYADNADASATNALTYRNAAASSATDAGDSESAAASSASSADNSKDTAVTAAQTAISYADTATTQSGYAEDAANSALAQAGLAEDYALDAASSALEATSGRGQVNIAVIGDSMSSGNIFADNWVNQFTEKTNQLGLNTKVFNWAVGGSTMHTALYTQQHDEGTKSQVDKAIDCEPDIVFVSLGIIDSVYAPVRTNSQVKQDGYNVYFILKGALPNAKIVLMNWAPYDVDSLGYFPGNIANKNCIPMMQETVYYKGLWNSKVNNSTFLDHYVSWSGHREYMYYWGAAASYWNGIYDDTILIDLWKLGRMGGFIDELHIDNFSHMWVVNEVINWYRSNNDVDNLVLNAAWADIDDIYYQAVTLKSYQAEYWARYLGIDIKKRVENWFYSQRNIDFEISPSDSVVADLELHLKIKGGHANKLTYTSFGTGNLLSTSRYTDARGNIHISATPAQVGLGSTGTHLCGIASLSSDGNVIDVYETNINVTTAGKMRPEDCAEVHTSVGSGDYTVPTADTFLPLEFPEVIHTDGNVNVSTDWLFTAPVDGIYQCVWNVRFRSVPANTLFVLTGPRIWDGTTTGYENVSISPAPGYTKMDDAGGVRFLKLNKDDEVNIVVYQFGSSGAVVNGNGGRVSMNLIKAL